LVDDWPGYNEALVRRGMIPLDLDLLRDWGDEVEEMNRDKEGGRYLYPPPSSSCRPPSAPASVSRTASWRDSPGACPGGSHGSWRRTSSTTCRRVNGLDIGLEPRLDPDEPVTIAVDASGIKVADRGEWLRMKWRKRRGFLKIHIAVDVKTRQILAMEVTDERTGDGGMLKPLVEGAETHCRVVKALGDGGYDSRLNFTYLAGKGIEPAIKVRRNSSRRARGCPARKRVVLEYLRDPEAWKRRVGYGRRWMAETAFSTFKRLFGEHVRARTLPNMIREMLLKARLYNLFTSLNPAPVCRQYLGEDASRTEHHKQESHATEHTYQ